MRGLGGDRAPFQEVDALAAAACLTSAPTGVAYFSDPHAIRAILASLGLPAEVPQPDPAHPPPVEAGDLPAAVS